MASILDEQATGRSILDSRPTGRSILDSSGGGGSILNHGAPAYAAAKPKPTPQLPPFLRDLSNPGVAFSNAYGRVTSNIARNLLRGTASNASALSQAIDYPRARSQEAIFHRGSSDANRKALREALGIEQGYEDPTLFGSGDHRGIPIPGWLGHAFRGTEDAAFDAGTDPTGPLLGGLKSLIGFGARGVGAGARALLHLVPEEARTSAEAVREAGQTWRPQNFTKATWRPQRVAPGLTHPQTVSLIKPKAQRFVRAPVQPQRTIRAASRMGSAAAQALQESSAPEHTGLMPLLHLGARAIGAGTRTALRNAPETLERLNATGRTLQNHFGLGGANAVKLERDLGKEAKDQTLGASAHSDTEAAHIKTLLQRNVQQALRNVKPADQATVLKALNGEIPIPSSGPLRDAILKIRKTTDDAYYLQGTPGTQRVFPYVRSRVNTNVRQAPRPASDFESMVPETTRSTRNQIVRVRGQALPEKAYNLAPNLREFATVPGAAPLDKFRSKYVTGLRPDTANMADSEGFTVKPEEYFNPNLLRRGEIKIDKKNPQKHIDALNLSLSNAGRAVGSARLNERLRRAFNGEIPQQVSDALMKQYGPTGANRTDLDKTLDLGRQVTGYGKAAMTQLTPFHAANVAALHLLNNMEMTPQVLSRFAKLMKNRNNPEKAYELMRPGVESGAIGPAKDHESYFGKIPLLGPWSKLMGDITWGLDNAAKSEYAKRLGGTYSAGRRAAEDMIDYRNSSDFSRNVLSLLSRFPTYRSQLLPAVAKSVLRDPRRAQMLMRLSGGALTGNETDLGNGHRLKSYTSVADAGRGFGDATGYFRSTLSDPQKAALTLALAKTGRSGKYFTYGKDVDLKYLFNYLSGGLPEGRDILTESGNGIFPGRGLGSDLLFANTGTVIK